MAWDWYTYKSLGSTHIEMCFRKFLKEEFALVNEKIREETLLHPHTEDGLRITSVGPDSITLENGEEVSVDDLYDTEAWQIIRMVYRPDEFQAAMGHTSCLTEVREIGESVGINFRHISHLRKMFNKP